MVWAEHRRKREQLPRCIARHFCRSLRQDLPDRCVPSITSAHLISSSPHAIEMGRSCGRRGLAYKVSIAGGHLSPSYCFVGPHADSLYYLDTIHAIIPSHCDHPPRLLYLTFAWRGIPIRHYARESVCITPVIVVRRCRPRPVAQDYLSFHI